MQKTNSLKKDEESLPIFQLEKSVEKLLDPDIRRIS
jgi:hypothetical protein